MGKRGQAEAIARTAAQGRNLSEDDISALARDVSAKIDRGMDEMDVLDWASAAVDAK